MKEIDIKRFWSRVRKTKTCWIWTAGILNSSTVHGYGQFKLLGAYAPVLAHRFSYELLVGKIPRGLTVDHLCKNRRCVNPEHMEIVTREVNTMRGNGACAKNARKTHCKRGHPLSGDNLYLYVNRGNRRGCRICMKLYYSQKKKAA